MDPAVSTPTTPAAWSRREELAEQMIPLIGRLHRENQVVVNIHGRSLINRSVTDIIKAHRWARQIDTVELDLEETLPLVQALTELELGAASVDLARLNSLYRSEGEGRELDAWLREQLAEVVGGKGRTEPAGQDVVLYGFGRIGRLLARILIERGAGSGLNLRAVVVRKNAENDLFKRASLLRRDSVHGAFNGTIQADPETDVITANGVPIQFIYSSDPAAVDYERYGIRDAVVIDNTGRWRDEEGLSQHLKAKGVAKVLLTAPGKGDLKNIVCGVNDHVIEDSDRILSAASCTTNAITPVLKVLDDEYGVSHGHVETVHSFTNDQNLLDVFHKDLYRARAATAAGVEPSYSGTFVGARRYVLDTFANTKSASMKRRVAQFMSAAVCPVCHGKRLKPEALTVTFEGLDIADFSALPLRELAELLESVVAESDREGETSAAVVLAGAKLSTALILAAALTG